MSTGDSEKEKGNAAFSRENNKVHGGKNSTYKGHQCTAELSDLEPVSTDRLRLNEVNVGKVLICRTIADSFVTNNALQTLIEDSKGKDTKMSVCNADSGNVLPIGNYLAVKEPWYKTSTNGKREISIDSLKELVCLERTHILLKNVTWRTKERTSGRDSWESFQKRGNEHFVAGKYEAAIIAYNEAIELRSTVAPREMADLLANRAAAFLGEEKPADALWDCRSALFVQPGHLKATFRMARGHAHLASYEQAKVVLEKSPHTTTPPVKTEILRLNRLIREQKFGDYDLKSLLREAAVSETPRLDHADYNGGVEVKWISKEKGKGLIARRDFALGELLFVCKAFEATYKSECSVSAADRLRGGESVLNEASRDECASRIRRRISTNRSLAKKFYQLYAGPDFQRFELEGGDAPPCDPARIAAILHFNEIGFNDFQGEGNLNLTDLPPFSAVRFGFAFGGYGVWILASFMNHSCVPNTIVFFVGDLMFARAGKKIARGEELTTSYVGSYLRYDHRQAELVRRFGFKCECPLCVCDLKRATEQPPDLALCRSAAIAFLEASVKRSPCHAAISLAKDMEETPEAVDYFPRQLAYKDRYDHGLQDYYNTLGNGYFALQQWLKAAKAYELAYFAAVGNGTDADNDTFSYILRTKDEIFIAKHIAASYLLGGKVAKAKEYLGKLQRAAEVAWGSADLELLEMFYPRLDLRALFKSLN